MAYQPTFYRNTGVTYHKIDAYNPRTGLFTKRVKNLQGKYVFDEINDEIRQTAIKFYRENYKRENIGRRWVYQRTGTLLNAIDRLTDKTVKKDGEMELNLIFPDITRPQRRASKPGRTQYSVMNEKPEDRKLSRWLPVLRASQSTVIQPGNVMLFNRETGGGYYKAKKVVVPPHDFTALDDGQKNVMIDGIQKKLFKNILIVLKEQK